MANEKRLIDARYLTPQMYLICEACQTENIFIDAIIDEIDNAPTVDAVEVVHGEWVCKDLDNFRKVEVKCSECGWIGIENYDSYVDPSDFNYCPNCGAKMDADDLEE